MIPLLEGWSTKAKEALFPHDVKMILLDTNPVFECLGIRVIPKIILRKYPNVRREGWTDPLFHRILLATTRG